MLRQALTLKQAADLLQVTYGRAADMARKGLLPVIRLGRQVRVCPEELEGFIKKGGRALPGGWRRLPQ